MTLEIDDPQLSAEEAGLRYVNDAMPGIGRRRAGKAFSYIGADGDRIDDQAELRGSRAWPSRQPGRMSGSAPSSMATSRPRVAMRVDESSIATTRAGGRFTTKRSTGG